MQPLGPDQLDRDLRPSAPARQDAASFWDHLSLTRADEYAAEDTLATLPIPPVPVQVYAPQPDLQAPMALPDWTELSAAPDPACNLPDPAWTLPQPAIPAAPQPQARAVADAPKRGRKPATARHSSARSGKLAYRLQRIWLTPLYRRAITMGLPLGALILSVAVYLADTQRREALWAQADALYAMIVDRPEFMVTTVAIQQTLAPELEAAIREIAGETLPQSSFRLDLPALRQELERLDAIRLADLRLSADNQLAISVTERIPALLWRSTEGIEVLDADGVRIGFVLDRTALPHLPLVAGEGANTRVAEALDLFDAAHPLRGRLQGLVHVGERRWDVVLDRDQTVRLPEQGAVAALERAIALDQAQDLLARDILVADLRNPARPVLQVSAGALETIKALRGVATTESISR
jgi:cell division protein FtsQ